MSPPLIQTVPCYQDSHTWHYIMKEMGYGTTYIPDLLDSVELSTSGGLIQNSLDSTRVVVNNRCATSIIPSGWVGVSLSKNWSNWSNHHYQLCSDLHFLWQKSLLSIGGDLKISDEDFLPLSISIETDLTSLNPIWFDPMMLSGQWQALHSTTQRDLVGSGLSPNPLAALHVT